VCESVHARVLQENTSVLIGMVCLKEPALPLITPMPLANPMAEVVSEFKFPDEVELPPLPTPPLSSDIADIEDENPLLSLLACAGFGTCEYVCKYERVRIGEDEREGVCECVSVCLRVCVCVYLRVRVVECVVCV